MYTGPWVKVHKPPSSSERTRQGVPPVTRIHDDDAAQALGFREGIVGGLTLVSVTTGAIAASLGDSWYQGGLYSVRHRNPVYQGDVRVIWEESPPDAVDVKKIDFYLEDREGTTSTHGWASVTQPESKPLPPWQRNPVTHTSTGQDALPEMTIGSPRTPFQAIVNRQDAIERLDRISDFNWWHRIASPWGDPILTPFDVAYMLYQGLRGTPSDSARSPRLRTPMDAGTDLVIYRPLFVDQRYTLKPFLCDKWQTPRSVFFCTEYSYEDENGELVAAMQAYSVHLIHDLAPA